ncbi:MAG TPA: LEPR-XLL domain-containing protein, partial [Chlorobaculum sp.]|nr:LEPR-XLL domain-containing protein [Chlorobaculum sp.]
MKNLFHLEQLEPRILLSGDVLPGLLPLAESQISSQDQSVYVLEHAPFDSVFSQQGTTSDVADSACTVVIAGVADGITPEALLHPFETADLSVRNADPGTQGTLLADFSSEYSFTENEWDALEDGWRHLSSLIGETLSSDGFISGIPFLENGNTFQELFGKSEDLANLLQQPVADYGSSFGENGAAESVGGLLGAFSKDWEEGNLVALGKILGGYDAAKQELRFSLTLQIDREGRTGIDFSKLDDGTGLELHTLDQADYNATLSLDLEFGLDVVSDSFFSTIPDASFSVRVDAEDLDTQVVFPSNSGARTCSASGDYELYANFDLDGGSEEVTAAADHDSLLTASSASSGLTIALSFSGADVYQGVELLSVTSSDLFDAASPEIALQGSNLHPWNAGLQADLYVAQGERLTGSGALTGDLVNDGVVAPGNSPGHQQVSSFTQTADGTLLIELEGKSIAGTDYDWLDITGNANFGGKLQVSLLHDYKPTVGDTFDIITFGGSATGRFTNLTGLYGFDSDYYFELVQTSDKIQLVTKEILSGNDFSFVTDTLGSAYNDNLGMLLNVGYLVGDAPTSVTLSGNVELGDSFKLGGSFTFSEQVTPVSLALKDVSSAGSSSVSATSLTVGGRDLDLLFGSTTDGAGLKVSDVDFGLALFTPVSDSDSRSWLLTKGSIGSSGDASFVNLGPLSISSGTISFDISQGLGSSNTTVANLSSAPVAISDATGTIVTFNDNGSRGEYFDLAATDLDFSLADTVSVVGDFMFSADGTSLTAIGTDVNALFGTVDMNIGVTNATIGLITSKAAGTALQASGGFSANLGSDISLTATSSSILWKDSATSLTAANKVLSIGSSTFTFSDELVSSAGIQEVRVSDAVLKVGDFFNVSGDLAFHRGTSDLKDSSGVTVHTDVLTLGASGLSVFAGADGDSADRMGLALGNVDFALAVMHDQGSARHWTALKGAAQSVSAVGIPDVTLSGTNLSVSVNMSASDGTVIDFSKTSLLVATGVDKSVTLDFAGPFVKVAGTFDVAVDDFLSLSGSMAFEKKTGNLSVQTAGGTTSSLAMDILSFGGAGIDAFVGLNGGSAQQLGLVLAGTRFAVLMAQDQTNKKRKWSSVKAGAESASITGVDGVTLSAADATVEINKASAEDGSLLDFSAGSYSLSVGSGQSVAIDFDADKGELLTASGTISLDAFGFFSAT